MELREVIRNIEEKEENVMEKKDYQSVRWNGYVRKDGRMGIRNKVLVVYTVECASFVAKEIVRRTNRKDVEVVGFTGCCDNQYAVRMLLALVRHPNVGAVLGVGLGCEYTQPKTLAQKAREAGKEADGFYIQEMGGTEKSMEYGMKRVQEFLKTLENTPTAPMGFADLIVGCECGGSDYTSGLAGNATVGRFFDRLVDWNGTAVFEEIVEAVGLKKMLMDRAATDEVREKLDTTYEKALDHCRSIHQFSISSGNFVGGLSTIEEKSMGATIKSGTKPIVGVTKVSCKPDKKGLWLLDSTPDPYFMGFGKTNPNDSEGLMDLISIGCQVVFLVTGRGSVVGSAVSPLVKITGNTVTYNRMSDDMDFCAGDAISGVKSLDELSLELADLVQAVCEGKETNAERLGHKEYYIPYKYQNVDDVPLPCRA